ncbi:MAG: hypothetical protein U1F35_16610 [Steroidobacteraceae bacterium]
MRARLAEDGQSPPEHTHMLDSLRLHGNPFESHAASAWSGRGTWASELQHAEPRCCCTCWSNLAYRTPDEARAVVRLLQAAGVDFAIMLDDEPEFGGLPFDLATQPAGRAT